jgi:Raf kinase inhibitor-like YbhB/YbcL family protein
MDIRSDSIAADSFIGLDYAEPGAGGQNLSPALAWTPGPEGTASYAVTCFDPDAPTGSGWWHWVVTDIPAEVISLAEGAALPPGARAWPTDYGYSGWGGPWPPPGPAHHYEFRVHALSTARLDVPDEATSAVARMTMSFEVLDTAMFTALFANPAS